MLLITVILVCPLLCGAERPLPSLLLLAGTPRRNKAIAAYQAAGLQVSVLGETPLLPAAAGGPADCEAAADAALTACLAANEALLHRAVLKRPLSVLKYAMTLDGKIATGEMYGSGVDALCVCV